MADKCDVSRYHSQIVFHFDNAEDNISFLFTEEIVDDKKRRHSSHFDGKPLRKKKRKIDKKKDERGLFFYRSQMTKGCR